jgi:hypothetical protein
VSDLNPDQPQQPPAPQYAPMPPQQYPPGQQHPGPGVVYQQSKTNGFSIAALVLGIIWLYWIGSILALVFGYIAKGQIERSGGSETGLGMAIAGIVLGWIGVATLLGFVIIGFSL